MKKMLLIILVLIFGINFNISAFELVKVKDTNKYSLGLEYGAYSGGDGSEYYYGIKGGLKTGDKTYIKAVIGKTTNILTNEDKVLVMGKPMYCFKKEADFKLYGFGLVANFTDDISFGGGFGYEKNWGFGELAYTTDDYFILSSGLNIYF